MLIFTRSRSLIFLLTITFLLSSCTSHRIRELKTQNEMLSQRIQMLRQDSNAQSEQMEDLQVSFREIQARNVRLQAELNDLQKEAEELRTQLRNSRQALNNASHSRTELANQTMENSLEREAELLQQIETLEARLSSVELMLAEVEVEKESAQDALDVTVAELAELHGLWEELEAYNENLEATCSEVSSSLEVALSQADELNKRLAEMEEENSSLMASLKEKETTLAAQRARIAPEEVRQTLHANLQRILLPATSEGAANLTLTERGVMVSFLADELFQPSTTLISEKGARSLNALADVIKDGEFNEIIVTGHSDNTPIVNMPFPDNWELSGARASAVVRHLANVPGVRGSLFRAQSRSFHDPVADNTNPSGRRQNRRVELHLIPLAQSPQTQSAKAQ